MTPRPRIPSQGVKRAYRPTPNIIGAPRHQLVGYMPRESTHHNARVHPSSGICLRLRVYVDPDKRHSWWESCKECHEADGCRMVYV